MLNGRIRDFVFVDEILQSFEVEIPEKQIPKFKHINDVIRYIYQTAITRVILEVDIQIECSLECNALASSLSVKDADNSWQMIDSFMELVHLFLIILDIEISFYWKFAIFTNSSLLKCI